MRTTTILWNKAVDINTPEFQDHKAKLDTERIRLTGPDFDTYLVKDLWTQTTVQFTRVWPDYETAWAFCQFALDNGALSAQVDPE